MDTQTKAVRIASRIKKEIFRNLDENDMLRAFRLLDRWNYVYRVAFPGESIRSPGNMLDDWMETRVFESRF